MTAPTPRPVSASARVADAVARRHGLTGVPAEPTWRGATSDVFAGEHAVVKVAHARPDAVAALRTDVAVTRAVAAHGVAVPAVLVHGEDERLTWAVLERVPGTTLEELGRHSVAARRGWRAVGEQLALVHAVPRGAHAALDRLRTFRQTPDTDPRRWLAQRLSAAAVRPGTAAGLRPRLEAAAAAVTRAPLVLCHGDANAANVVVGPESRERVTLLDWAGAGWLDPVWDLASAPLAAVPSLLDGHRARHAMADEATVAARLTWCRAQLLLRRALDDLASGAGHRDAVDRELADLVEAAAGWWDRAADE
jgi:aminoglycoside phosphotransferase